MQSEGKASIDRRDVTVGEEQETGLMTGHYHKPHEAVFEKN